MGDVLAPLILADDTTTSNNALAATWIVITPAVTPRAHSALVAIWPFLPFYAIFRLQLRCIRTLR